MKEVRGIQQTTNLYRDVRWEAEETQSRDFLHILGELKTDHILQLRRVKRLKFKNTILSWTLFILVLGFFMLAGLWDIWSWGILIGIVLGVVCIWFGSEA